MKRIVVMHLAINLASATALSTPLLKEKTKPKPKSKPPEPHTPQERKAAQASPYRSKPAQQTYDKSLRAVQHAGKHKNKGTPKGVPFKR